MHQNRSSEPEIPDSFLRDALRWRHLTYLQPGLRHELAGVQNTLRLHVQLVARAAQASVVDAPRIARWAQVLKDELERLETLADRTLAWLAPDRANPRPAPAGRLTSEIVALLEPRAKELGLRLENRLPGDATLPVNGRLLEDLLLAVGVDALRRAAYRGQKGTLGWALLHREDEIGIGLEHVMEGDVEPIEPAGSHEPADEEGALILLRALVSQSGGRWQVDRETAGSHRVTLLWPLDAKESHAC